MQRLLWGSRLLLGLAALGLVAYAAVRLLARFWAWLALVVALAYLIMLALTLAAILLYMWFGLPGELDVHAPLCDGQAEPCGRPGHEITSVGTTRKTLGILPLPLPPSLPDVDK